MNSYAFIEVVLLPLMGLAFFFFFFLVFHVVLFYFNPFIFFLLHTTYRIPLKGFQCICRGADPRAVNCKGINPFELAVESNFGDSEVLALLAYSNG